MTNEDNNAWVRRAREWLDLQKLLTIDDATMRRMEDETPHPATPAETQSGGTQDE